MLNSNPDSLSFLHHVECTCARCGDVFNIERGCDIPEHCNDCEIELEEQAQPIIQPVSAFDAACDSMVRVMDRFLSVLP